MFAPSRRTPIGYNRAVDTAWIKRRLKLRSAAIADLARSVDRDRSVVSRIVSDDSPMPLWMTSHFAKVLGVSEIELLRRAGLNATMTQSVPVIAWAAASSFAEMIDRDEVDCDRYVAFDYTGGPLFALEVQGDSMDRVAPHGSLIAVSYTERDLKDRDLGVFRRRDEATFKRYRQDGDRLWLTPDSWSDRYAPIVPEGDDVIEVIGRVVGVPSLASSN